MVSWHCLVSRNHACRTSRRVMLRAVRRRCSSPAGAG
nr:MAG TPA: hypothetical protein [Caudoviricetes sp.]